MRACVCVHVDTWTAAGPGGTVRGKGGGQAPGAGEGAPPAHSPEVHQEDVLDLLQDLQLPEHVADLVALDALLFVHVLHGIHLLRVPLLHDAHLGAEGTSALPPGQQRSRRDGNRQVLCLWRAASPVQTAAEHLARHKAPRPRGRAAARASGDTTRSTQKET